MSSTSELRKRKRCNCIIVGCCLLAGTIILALSYGAFRDSKLYGAPTDKCIFTDASTKTEDCRNPNNGCNGLQRKFYYNTTAGTCEANELYSYSKCDCGDNPSIIPNTTYGYSDWDTCWIAGCESDEDWTFIEPVNQAAYGWIFLFIGLILVAVASFYCCKCLQIELEEGSPLMDEIGEKEAYNRFYEDIYSKERTNDSSKWKTLHRVVILSAVATPIILVGTFLIATFTYGANLSDNTISTGIQYRKKYNGMFRFTETMTMLSVFLASFVSWCRQVQIAVYFREYAKYFGTKSAKLYRWMNVIALVFNVVGYFAIMQLVSYDSKRNSSPHALWAGIAFFSTAMFLLFTAVITYKQRYIEYRRNKIVENQSSSVAFKNTFWYDVVIMIILFICGAVSLCVFFVELAYQNSKVSEGEGNAGKYVRDFGNTAEWMGFFFLVSGVGVLALNFHHDSVSWEIHDYLAKQVMLWPCDNYILKFLACCCCCCCEISFIENNTLEMQIKEEIDATDGGNNVKDDVNNDDRNTQTELVVQSDENDDNNDQEM